MDVVVIENGAKLVLQEEQLLGTSTHDRVDLVAAGDELARDGKGDGKPHSAADDGPLALSHLGGLAQGAGHVLQVVSRLVAREHRSGLADHHEDELDPALGGIPVRKGERHPLARLVGTNHEKLARVGMPGHLGRLDAELEHLLRELCLLENFVHLHTPLQECLVPMAFAIPSDATLSRRS